MYVDFHCDTLLRACGEGRTTVVEMPGASVDAKRLIEAKVAAQFFATFLFPRTDTERWERILGPDVFQGVEGFEPEDRLISKARNVLQNTLDANAEKMTFARTGSDLKRAMADGKTAAFFTLEDGRSVGGSFEKLKQYQDLGVSLISLTWNYENCFGYPNSSEPEKMNLGLKPFGKEAIEYMNEIGMVVDVSHLSDGGFWDVVSVTKKPFVASHSNCRAISPHQRNLTDEMIRALAEKGGVAGLNLYAKFLNADVQCSTSMVSDMVAHIQHMICVGGLECAALGTDFDGIQGTLEVGDPTRMEILFEALRKSGLSQDAIDQIAWKNGLRVLCDIAG